MSKKRGPRGLRPDELALWREVQNTATPLHPARHDATSKKPRTRPEPARAVKTDLQDFRIGRTAPQTRPTLDLVQPLGDRLSKQQVIMDARKFTKMKRGKVGIDARIDLHGQTLDQAHGQLTRFIHGAYASGHRLVLVITGKGKDRDLGGPIPVQRGLLKHQVPQWLTSGSLRPMVLQISEAHRSHGGSGAYYVYLRRSRQ